MSQQVFVQVRFQEKTPYGDFHDALYFSEAEYATAKQKDIDDLVDGRVAAHVDRIKNAPAPVEPTKQELQAQLAEVLKQVDELNVKIEEKNAK